MYFMQATQWVYIPLATKKRQLLDFNLNYDIFLYYFGAFLAFILMGCWREDTQQLASRWIHLTIVR